MRLTASVFFYVLTALSFSRTASAQAHEKSARINLSASGAIRINYGQPRWNKNPNVIDTATVILREGVSGRVVQIQLNETAPDSSIFSGLYSINWQNLDQLQTEFYIPSQEMLAQKDGLMKVTQKIQAREIRRNPFIFRRLPDGGRTIEIFDTKEQAHAALKAYQAELLVQDQGEQQNAAKVAAKAASDRARLAQIESARLADLIVKQNAMTANEKADRGARAQSMGAEGLRLYKADDFIGARVQFDQAVNLDPDNRQFYFQYGVTLYKLEDYDHALVFLEMANGESVNPSEKNYFIALSHLKLKEPDAALKSFAQVTALKDEVLAPSAQFYRGAIEFEQERFDEAQASFQAVLDTSKDSKLDDRAEAFIEQIIRARQISNERRHHWVLSSLVGEMFDSNVLLSSDSQRDAGTATGSSGWRSLLGGTARYRPVYDDMHEFAVQLDVVSLYTLDRTFALNQSLRNADPTVFTLTLPWTHKGMWLSKGHKLDIIPGYETTVMSVENNVSKAIILSPLVSISNLLVMNDKWFNNVTLDMRDDISRLDSSVGDDNASALKFRLGTTNLLFLNEKKDRIFIPEMALTMNQAAGRNASYNRFDLGFGYLLPSAYTTTTNFKLSYDYLDYSQKLPAQRADNSYTATVGVSKKLTEIWNAGCTGSYNANRSNEDANTYSKFTVLVTLGAAYSF